MASEVVSFLNWLLLISRWFRAEKIALMVGLVVTLAMLGGMVAQAPLRFLVSSFNFATAMKINIGFGVGCWLLILFVVRDSPAGRDIDAGAHAELSDMGFLASVYQVLRNSQNWLAGIYASLINLPVFWLGGYKGGDYLQQVDHLTAKQSEFVVGLLFIGLIFGSPLFGYFSDKIKRRRLPMVVGACASILVTVLITWVDIQSESLLAILFFLLGIVISSQVIAYPLVVESNSLSLTGTAEGVTSVLIMSGGFTTSIMLMFLEKGKTGLHSTVFSALGWHWALSALIGCFVVALFLSMIIRETRCKHCESK
jgi:sugar phosphate permease